MKHHYRPSFIGLVICAYALLAAFYAVRWSLEGSVADGAGAAVGAVLLGLLGWRIDVRPAVGD